ncbi:MAG: glycosyltransferase family 39 protein [Proteobacteria bacterium]|nr:glycosyltransferase family 39 protein [Pseudomonadota bacterium]
MRFFLSWFATFGIDSPLIYTRTAELSSGVIPPFAIHVPITHNAFIPGPGIAVLYYLMFSITRNPIYVGMITGVLQILGIFVLYRLFSQIYSKKTAGIVAFLMLLNPWLCYYSVGLWNPGLIFLFSSLAFYSLYKLKNDNKSVYWATLAFSICMAAQVHMSAFLLIVVCAAYLLFYRIWPKIKDVFTCLCIFVFLFFPYIRYEIINNGKNTLALFSGATGTSFKLESLLRALHFSVIFQSDEIAHFAGAGIYRAIFFYKYHPLLSVVLIPLSILTVYFSYVMFWTFLKNNFSMKKLKTLGKVETAGDSTVAFLFIVAFIINPLIYYFTPRPFSPHNLIVIAPFLWIPIASFVDKPGKLFFPYLRLKQLGYIYVIASLIAVYMILVSHPYQVPVKDVIKIAGFIGQEQNTPVYLEGVEEITQIDALETLHKNYFARTYKLIADSEKDAKTKFILMDKRRQPITGNIVFETSTAIVLQK